MKQVRGWLAAIGAGVLAVALSFGMLPDVCSDSVAQVGTLAAVTTCRPLSMIDPPIVLALSLLLILLLPDLSEVGFAGLTLKRVVEDEGEKTRAEVAEIRQAIAASSSAQANPIAIASGYSVDSAMDALEGLLGGPGLDSVRPFVSLEMQTQFVNALAVAHGLLMEVDSLEAASRNLINSASTDSELSACLESLSSSQVVLAGVSTTALRFAEGFSSVEAPVKRLRSLVRPCEVILRELSNSPNRRLRAEMASVLEGATQDLIDGVGAIRSILRNSPND